jgi:riboflavin kinase/FMN adenylyltransferase
MMRRTAPVVAVGEFDGFHLGHRELLHAALTVATRERRPLVAVVMDDCSATDRVDGVEERCRRALAAGAAATQVVSVDSADALAGARLVADLVQRLGPASVVMACLPDDGEVRYPALRAELSAHRVPLIEVERWLDQTGVPITSARVRAAVAAGDIARANEWLGRPLTLDGVVVHGSALGRTIGFATANLEPPERRLLPARGVYAADVTLPDRRRFAAAVNIGVRPTVSNDGHVLVEAHLLDFDEDIYGERISVAFRAWLRHEQRFASLDELTAQLAADVRRTRLVSRHP